ncbi:DNA translocase FtsK [Serratia symbiotica]|nr:DNA translocase FtsK [Serratia symbiotica]
MNHKYINKIIFFKKIYKYEFLIKFFFMLNIIFYFYLIGILISFEPSDPSWLQITWNKSIHNFGGSFGAWLADILLFIFGIVAYLIPLMMLGLYWMIYCEYIKIKYINYFLISLRFIGLFMIIFSSCSLLAFYKNNFYDFSIGGIIGSFFNNFILYKFSNIYIIILLFCFLLVGIILFIGLLWLKIIKKLIIFILNIINFFKKYKI